MLLTWILIGLAALIVIICFVYYNRFAILGNRIDNSLSQIDVQLKRRADLIPNLLESVKGYMKHEKTVLTEVTKARTSFLNAKDMSSKVKAGDMMQNALKSIFAVAENYPQLKASETFLQLQQELSTTEDKIAYSRQYYNDSILTYENKRKTFPGNFFAGLYSFKQREYLQIAESERKPVKVKFE